MELDAVKHQMHSVKSSATEMKRLKAVICPKIMSFACNILKFHINIKMYLFYRQIDEKEKNIQDALQRMQIFEREIAARDAEVNGL